MRVVYDAKGDRFVVTGSRRDFPMVKAIDGHRTLETGAVWSVPATRAASLRAHAELLGADWAAGAMERGKELKERAHLLLALQSADPVDPRLSARLAPKQRELAHRIVHGGSVLLAAQTGSGKTVVVCDALRVAGASTVLLITTKSTLYKWADHLREWTHVEPFVHHGTKAQRSKVFAAYQAHEGPKALIGTHASMRGHSRLAHYGFNAAEGDPGSYNTPFEWGVIDEIHKAGKDPNGKSARAMMQIAANCTHRVGMSGTPWEKWPADDLWTVSQWVCPAEYPSRGGYRATYCRMKEMWHGGTENHGIRPEMQEEFDRSWQPYFMAADKRVVFEGLPEPLPLQVLRLPMEGKQASIYAALEKDMMAKVDGGTIVEADWLQLHKKLEYAACGVPVVDGEGSITGVAAPSNKLDYIMELAEARAGDPFVVFADSLRVARMIQSALEKAEYSVGSVCGPDSAPVREAHIKAFQAGKLDVLVMTAAGAEGIDLTAADLLVLCMESWQATINEQVGDRIDRFGQGRPPQRIVLVSEGTVDETRRLAVVEKISRQQALLKDRRAVR